METINERILQCVRSSGLTKTEFAKRLKITQAYVSALCSGKKTPSDRTIADICRVFNINEEWLRNGEGETFVKTPDAIVERLTQEIKLDTFLQSIAREYLNLPEAQREIVRNFIYSISSDNAGISTSEAVPQAVTENNEAIAKDRVMNKGGKLTDEEIEAIVAQDTEEFRKRRFEELKGKVRLSVSQDTKPESTGKKSLISGTPSRSTKQNTSLAQINNAEGTG